MFPSLPLDVFNVARRVIFVRSYTAHFLKQFLIEHLGRKKNEHPKISFVGFTVMDICYRPRAIFELLGENLLK